MNLVKDIFQAFSDNLNFLRSGKSSSVRSCEGCVA